MAITQTYPFTTSTNYTLSNTSVSGGFGKLSLEDNLSQAFTEAFSSDSGFTYDNTKSEFSGGALKSKGQNPYLSALGATYTSTLNASWNIAGSTTATLVGSPTLSGGKVTTTSTQSVKYVMTSRNDGNGCLRFKYTPGYTGAPGSNYDIIGYNPDNGTNNGRFDVFHQGVTGQIKISVNNSAGTIVYGTQTIGSAWLPTSGVEYELEFNWDYSTGDIRLFIDGALHGLLNSAGPWTHTGAANVTIFVGANARNVNLANASYNDVVFFDGVKHTAPYTAGYTLPEYLYTSDVVTLPSFTYGGPGSIQAFTGFIGTTTGTGKYIVNDKYWNGSAWVASAGTYAQANTLAEVNTNIPSLAVVSSITFKIVTTDNTNTQDTFDSVSLQYTGQKYKALGYIEPAMPIQVEGISAYSHTVTTPGSTNLGVIIKVDGVLKYWNGSAWVTSDGSYAQSNDAATVNTNIGSMSFGSNSSVYIRWVLATSDTSVTPDIDTASVDYDFGGVEIDAATCLVYGYVKDIRNVGIQGVTVSFQLDTSSSIYSEAANNIIDSGSVSVTTDAYGYFEIDLIKSSEYEGTRVYKMSLTYNNKTVSKTSSGKLLVTVPDADTKDVTDLLTAL